jgi:hypothetical protein
LEDLVFQLNVSESVTVIPMLHDDFLDYDVLLKDIMYIDLAGKVKQNHIFLCSGNALTLVSIFPGQSNLDEHATTSHKALKRLRIGSGVLKLVVAIFHAIGRPVLLRDRGHINANFTDATASPPGCVMPWH